MSGLMIAMLAFTMTCTGTAELQGEQFDGSGWRPIQSMTTPYRRIFYVNFETGRWCSGEDSVTPCPHDGQSILGPIHQEDAYMLTRAPDQHDGRGYQLSIAADGRSYRWHQRTSTLNHRMDIISQGQCVRRDLPPGQ